MAFVVCIESELSLKIKSSRADNCLVGQSLWIFLFMLLYFNEIVIRKTKNKADRQAATLPKRLTMFEEVGKGNS